MTLYRFHLLERNGAVNYCKVLQLPSDGAAFQAGERFLQQHTDTKDKVLEIWHLNRLVHRSAGSRAIA